MMEVLTYDNIVPPKYFTPAAQGGLLDEVYSFVVTTYNEKVLLANSQITPNSNPRTCLPAPSGNYCKFFYNYPSGGRSTALFIKYQQAMSAYNTDLSNQRYELAFGELTTAYNSLFVGQRAH